MISTSTSDRRTRPRRSPPKRALITGITGQDGSYLAELLLSKGYEVHGLVRRSSSLNRSRIDHLQQGQGGEIQLHRFYLHYGDMTDAGGLNRLLRLTQPDEIYNLAAQSHVHISFDQPEYTGDVVGLGVVRLLEAIRTLERPVRFYQASTSEMFGSSPAPQSEDTPFQPRSPYAAAKAYAHQMTVNYREAHGLFACCGILFNHESPRRAENFVTRKVTRGVAQAIATGRPLRLGHLEAMRDWGHARDYVDAMWRMLQLDEPGDYVIGTGESHSVRELVELAFGLVGLDWREHVELDPAYLRPTDTNVLQADTTKAREALGWVPRTSFEELIREMLEHDLQVADLPPEDHLVPALPDVTAHAAG